MNQTDNATEALKAQIRALILRSTRRILQAERARLTDPSGYRKAQDKNQDELKKMMVVVGTILDKAANATSTLAILRMIDENRIKRAQEHQTHVIAQLGEGQ